MACRVQFAQVFTLSGVLLTSCLARAGDSIGPVDANTTLWRLALSARPDAQVTMPQVIYALWHHNPAAFREQNVHYLLQGAVLQLPSRERMLAVSAQDAEQWYYHELAQQSLPAKIVQRSISTAADDVTTASSLPQREHGSAAPEPEPGPVPEPEPEPERTAQSMPIVAAPAEPTAPSAPVAQPASLPAAATDSLPVVARGSYRWQQQLALEQRWFAHRAEQPAARLHHIVSYRALWSYENANRNHQFTAEPFLRWHQHDSDSKLLDLPQANWRYFGDGWQLTAGVDTVFWGVTESQQLVNVINQTDLTANVEQDAKLGQPLIQLRRSGNAGTLDLFVMPYFRERQFPSPAGRLGPPLPVNHDVAWYQSSDGKQNLDLALRYSQRFSGVDAGLSFFSGNNREPTFRPLPSGELQPLYWQMEQYGLDLLWISGDWLWKFESIYRRSSPAEFVAATAGFEYTQIGVWQQVWDLGWIAEYQYDSRGQAATSPGQNDLFVGWRLALNDVAGTEFLLGVLQDLDYKNSRSIKLEGALRLTDSLRLSINGWVFSSQQPAEPLYLLRRDDYLALLLDYYF
ncbi:FimV/HubP family polar landmark protein [Arsukibacterium sp.]|uniref:FimV/HubP family polar landmark protein n=1 Tax=Arsukibacterium sp. TaxID=1977258 RepID=UPI002FD9CCBA